MIKVLTNNLERKTEYLMLEPQYQEYLDIVLQHFDIQGKITGVSYDEKTKYGVYILGKPTVSPIDFSGFETDPLTNHLVSLKIDLSDNSVRGKVYYVGNIKNVEFHRPVAGTGLYVGEDSYTVYYPTEGDIPTKYIQSTMTQKGFSATTFYADGSNSAESVYSGQVYEPNH
jgi:hypothetical protein